MTHHKPGAGFTLLELLVVIAIIGLLAAVGIPAVSELTKSNTASAASSQLADDLTLARNRAIADRTTVYVVFVPSDFTGITVNAQPGPLGSVYQQRDLKTLETLRDSKYTTYALFARRSVGDQPGPLGARARYLTSWRSLPDGAFIAPAEFESYGVGASAPQDWLNQPAGYGALPQAFFPFPSVDSNNNVLMPYIAFNHQGQLVQPDYAGWPMGTQLSQDVHVSEGAIFYQRDPDTGAVLEAPPEIQEVPPGAGTNNVVRIDWLTGRAAVDRPQVQN